MCKALDPPDYGVSLPAVWEFLDVLIPGKQLSVATLGRRSKAAGDKAGQLLPIFDEWARERVRDRSLVGKNALCRQIEWHVGIELMSQVEIDALKSW